MSLHPVPLQIVESLSQVSRRSLPIVSAFGSGESGRKNSTREHSGDRLLFRRDTSPAQNLARRPDDLIAGSELDESVQLGVEFLKGSHNEEAYVNYTKQKGIE